MTAGASNIGTLTTGSLTFGDNTTVYNAQLGTGGASHALPGVSDLLQANGNLVVNAGGTIKLANNAGANGQGSLSSGTYKLISYTSNGPVGTTPFTLDTSDPSLSGIGTPGGLNIHGVVENHVAADKAVYLDAVRLRPTGGDGEPRFPAPRRQHAAWR